MSGVASIINPTYKSDSLLWTVTGASQLAVEVRSLSNSGYTKYQDEGCVPGVVRPATKLAATIHHRTVTVYGITTYPDSEKNTKATVASISPIYNPIVNIATEADKADPKTYNALAATGDGNQYDWVYFLQDPKGKTQAPNITEFEFNETNQGGRYVYDKLEPDPMSNLAAVFHASSRNRMIIFQGYDDLTLYYAWSNNKRELPIDHTNNAVKGTPLAASLVELGDGTFEVYVYYIDSNKNLTRVVYSGIETNGVWGSPTKVFNAQPANAATGLTCIPDTTKEANHVYYKRGLEETYFQLSDPFRKRSLSTVEPEPEPEPESVREHEVAEAAHAEGNGVVKKEHHDHHHHKHNGHAVATPVES